MRRNKKARNSKRQANRKHLFLSPVIRRPSSESGNVFLFILLGVVLFAALAFTVSRGFRSQTTSTLSDRQAELIASDLLNYAQALERGVNRVRRKGISETDLCFAHPSISAGNNTNYSSVSECANLEHNIFDREGGGVSYKPVLTEWLDPAHSARTDFGEWMFTMSAAVLGLGDGALNLTTSSEILAHVNYLDEKICESINDKLGIAGIPDNGTTFPIAASYSGTAFASGNINPAGLDGRYSGCFENSSVWSGYVFYHVLVERD